MLSTADRLEFIPPSEKGSPRAFGLALLVHVLLIAALTWGVSWKQTDESASFEAELWSGAVQQAAPQQIAAPVPTPAPPPPVPAPQELPAPAPLPRPPPPVAKAPEVRETPPLPDVDIALENEKKRKLLRQQKEAEVLKAQKLQDKREAELQAREARELEKKKEKEQQAREDQAERKARELAQKAEAKKQEAREQANQKEQDKRTAAAEKQKQAAADKQKAVAAAAAASQQKQAAATAAASEKQHQDAVRRIMGMAGAGNADGAGTSAKASGPSAGYAGKVRAKVLPNVVFTDDIAGNPVAEVRVTTTADGTIMSQSLTKSSGNKAWDEAVIKAIIRTGSLPRDVDGQVPTPITLVFRPN